MPDFDWNQFGAVNAWQSIATIAVVIIALFIITRLLIKFWPWLKKVIALFDALGQLPEFITRTDKAIIGIHKETTRNGGSSLKDAQVRTEEAVERIELGVKGLYDRADEQLRQDLEMTKPPTRKWATKPKEQS